MKLVCNRKVALGGDTAASWTWYAGPASRGHEILAARIARLDRRIAGIRSKCVWRAGFYQCRTSQL